MPTANFSQRDRVRTNKFHDHPGETGTVYETFTSGPNEDFPVASIEWDDPRCKSNWMDDYVPFEELEYIPDPEG